MPNVFEDSLSQHVQKLGRGPNQMRYESPHLRDLRPNVNVYDRSIDRQSPTVQLNPAELPKEKK